MRDLFDPEINQYRITNARVLQIYGIVGDSSCGVFEIPVSANSRLFAIASCGGDWDHVSVSHPSRQPSWTEMEKIKRLFFGDEVVMQLHVAKKDHINVCQTCLHLWRPQKVEIPCPPKAFV